MAAFLTAGNACFRNYFGTGSIGVVIFDIASNNFAENVALWTIGTPQLYAEVSRKGEALLEAARQAALCGTQTIDVESACPDGGGRFVGLNTLSFPRQEIIRIPLQIYDGRSAFTLSKAHEDSGFIIAKDKTGNGLIELEGLENMRANIRLATGNSSGLEYLERRRQI
jgi:hypothetical protein